LQIESEEDLLPEHVIKAYKVDGPLCTKSTRNILVSINAAKKKKNCVGNPNCVFGLGEGKEDTIESLFGADPEQQAREEGNFVGLKVRIFPFVDSTELGRYMLYEQPFTSIFFLF
jgi:hypothetical protein